MNHNDWLHRCPYLTAKWQTFPRINELLGAITRMDYDEFRIDWWDKMKLHGFVVADV